MDIDDLLKAIRNSLLAITEPRFYETERGFQGQLIVELSRRIPEYSPAQRAIIEQEHQKTLNRHGLNIRPDIIIHRSFDPAVHASRREGNFAVIELKLRASPRQAVDDIASLISMLDILHYKVGIFINVGCFKTHANHIHVGANGRIVLFAVDLKEGSAQVVEHRA